MKSTPDPNTTPAQKYTAFEKGLHQLVTVSKEELLRREKLYQEERASKPKRGPKVKS